jgi:hypothetical protein
LNDLTEIIDGLQQLKTMHQLNLELLEQLDIACGWLIDNNIQVPNASTFCSLLNRAKALLNEIRADSPKTLVYKKLSDGRKHPPESDGEVPVPRNWVRS